LEKPDETELFDVSVDPFDQKNLLPEDGAEAASLKDLVKGYEENAASPWGAKPGVAELDELRLNHLRALGYVITPDPKKPEPKKAELPKQ
ncbi:MAG TPA: hypothetical protein VFC77_07735, partial [Myxococcota bacterium]|nr:hypothetical protein [Myxococcota bacterium]